MNDEKMSYSANDLEKYKRTFLRHWAKKLAECAEREDILEVHVGGSQKRDLRPMYGELNGKQHQLLGFKQEGPQVITIVITDYARAGRSLDLCDCPCDLPQDAIDADIEGQGR